MNASAKTLAILSPLLIVVGVIIAFTASRNAEQERLVEEFRSTLSAASPYDSSAGSGADAWMWAGIIMALLGVVIVIGNLFLNAAQRRTTQTRP